MSIFEAVICGIIQGLTEFLPVSSSGHLSIFQNIFGLADVEANYFSFDILLHLGTLIVVFFVYWKDVIQLVKDFFGLLKLIFTGKFKYRELSEGKRLVIFVLIATLPLVFVVFFKDYVEGLYRSLNLIAILLIFNGIVLFMSDKISNGTKDVATTRPRDALITGLCQVAAVLPGISRSGSTITGGRFCGFSREYAVKFSFLLSIPAILGANILSIPEFLTNPIPSSDILPYICGVAAAMISGFCAIKLLIYISKKGSFKVFSIYCACMGLAVLGYSLFFN